VLPPDGTDAVGKMVDVTMLVLTGGMERTEAEYRELMTAAGFRLAEVYPSAASFSILESVPVEA